MFHALPEHFASARWRFVPSLHLSHRLLCRFPRRVRGARHLWRTLKAQRSTICDLSTASFGLDAFFIERVHRTGDLFLIFPAAHHHHSMQGHLGRDTACGESIRDVLHRPSCRRRATLSSCMCSDVHPRMATTIILAHEFSFPPGCPRGYE